MPYEPIVARTAEKVRATALVGIHSVILGFDFLGSGAERENFLGFAIHRSDLTEGEAWWLTGQIRFKGDAADFGEDVPTNRGPLQKFHWGDYTTKPNREYRYEIHPIFGRPGSLEHGSPAVLEVTTTSNSTGQTAYYFNRGVTAALAYRRRFLDRPPKDVPHRAAYRWLSRGLEEALISFIRDAVKGDELKIAIYEFEHEEIIAALKTAKKKGVRLRIVYHAKPGDKQAGENRVHVETLGVAASRVIPRKQVQNISHNKFIVHERSGAPVKVWTGSTNFTEAGLYLQTNVGIVFHEAAIARAYNECFELLAQDPAAAELKTAVSGVLSAAEPTLPEGCSLFFSPVAGRALLDAANDVVRSARNAVFISCPFGLDGSITKELNQNNDEVLEYGLVNTTNRKRLLDLIDRSVNSLYATPTWIKNFDGRLWDAKAYGNHKIHVKSILSDPWGPHPRLLIGSANFSDESVNKNDENAVLIEGDRRATAIAATEFLRAFDHYKFRDYMSRMKKKEQSPERFLVEDGSWTADYFDTQKAKFRERIVFSGA